MSSSLVSNSSLSNRNYSLGNLITGSVTNALKGTVWVAKAATNLAISVATHEVTHSVATNVLKGASWALTNEGTIWVGNHLLNGTVYAANNLAQGTVCAVNNVAQGTVCVATNAAKGTVCVATNIFTSDRVASGIQWFSVTPLNLSLVNRVSQYQFKKSQVYIHSFLQEIVHNSIPKEYENYLPTIDVVTILLINNLIERIKQNRINEKPKANIERDQKREIENEADLNREIENEADLKREIENEADLKREIENEADLNREIENEADLKREIENEADLKEKVEGIELGDFLILIDQLKNELIDPKNKGKDQAKIVFDFLFPPKSVGLNALPMGAPFLIKKIISDLLLPKMQGVIDALRQEEENRMKMSQTPNGKALLQLADTCAGLIVNQKLKKIFKNKDTIKAIAQNALGTNKVLIEKELPYLGDTDTESDWIKQRISGILVFAFIELGGGNSQNEKLLENLVASLKEIFMPLLENPKALENFDITNPTSLKPFEGVSKILCSKANFFTKHLFLKLNLIPYFSEATVAEWLASFYDLIAETGDLGFEMSGVAIVPREKRERLLDLWLNPQKKYEIDLNHEIESKYEIESKSEADLKCDPERISSAIVNIWGFDLLKVTTNLVGDKEISRNIAKSFIASVLGIETVARKGITEDQIKEGLQSLENLNPLIEFASNLIQKIDTLDKGHPLIGFLEIHLKNILFNSTSHLLKDNALERPDQFFNKFNDVIQAYQRRGNQKELEELFEQYHRLEQSREKEGRSEQSLKKILKEIENIHLEITEKFKPLAVDLIELFGLYDEKMLQVFGLLKPDQGILDLVFAQFLTDTYLKTPLLFQTKIAESIKDPISILAQQVRFSMMNDAAGLTTKINERLGLLEGGLSKTEVESYLKDDLAWKMAEGLIVRLFPNKYMEEDTHSEVLQDLFANANAIVQKFIKENSEELTEIEKISDKEVRSLREKELFNKLVNPLIEKLFQHAPVFLGVSKSLFSELLVTKSIELYHILHKKSPISYKEYLTLGQEPISVENQTMREEYVQSLRVKSFNLPFFMKILNGYLKSLLPQLLKDRSKEIMEQIPLQLPAENLNDVERDKIDRFKQFFSDNLKNLGNKQTILEFTVDLFQPTLEKFIRGFIANINDMDETNKGLKIRMDSTVEILQLLKDHIDFINQVAAEEDERHHPVKTVWNKIRSKFVGIRPHEVEEERTWRALHLSGKLHPAFNQLAHENLNQTEEQRQKNVAADKLETFYKPLFKKVLNISGLKATDLPLLGVDNENLFNKLQESIGPQLLNLLFDQMMQPATFHQLKISSYTALESFLESMRMTKSWTESNAESNIKESRSQEERELDKACGGALKEIINWCPWLIKSILTMETLQKSQEEALGLALRNWVKTADFEYLLKMALTACLGALTPCENTSNGFKFKEIVYNPQGLTIADKFVSRDAPNNEPTYYVPKTDQEKRDYAEKIEQDNKRTQWSAGEKQREVLGEALKTIFTRKKKNIVDWMNEKIKKIEPSTSFEKFALAFLKIMAELFELLLDVSFFVFYQIFRVVYVFINLNGFLKNMDNNLMYAPSENLLFKTVESIINKLATPNSEPAAA